MNKVLTGERWYNWRGRRRRMEQVLEYLTHVEDKRQARKVMHKMSDIIALVFLAMLSGADEWTTYEIFGKEHEGFLRQYLELPNGIPSHDTIERVFAMVSPEFLQGFKTKWHEMLNSDEGEKIRKLLALDGKSQRGNGRGSQKGNHIVSAVDEDGFSLREVRVDEKTNEITAIPELLDSLNIKGHIITTDAMGCQTEIVKKIRKKRADYVLAVKGNQPTLHEAIRLYFADEELLSKCDYSKTVEKARSGIEKREYWQTEDILWYDKRKNWAGLKSIAMTRNTVVRNGVTTTETRHFISSLPLDVKEIARAIRGHWMVESQHWHLDVTFREDGNHTLDKQAAFNQNIMRKLALSVLKVFDTGRKNTSIRAKRFTIGTNPEKRLAEIMNL
jgi:predicted transposase YbfD/YdcC